MGSVDFIERRRRDSPLPAGKAGPALKPLSSPLSCSTLSRPALCGSLGLRPPSSSTGRGGLRPHWTRRASSPLRPYPHSAYEPMKFRLQVNKMFSEWKWSVQAYMRTCFVMSTSIFASSHRCFRTLNRYVRMYTLCTHVHFCTLLFLFPYKSCAAKTTRAASVSYIWSRYVRMYTSFLVPVHFFIPNKGDHIK